MDIILGKIGVKPKQFEQAGHLKAGKIKGFGAVDDSVIVTTTEELTDKEKDDLIAALRACPETNAEKIKREQDHEKALDKIATAAGLSKDEKEAYKETRATTKEKLSIKK